MTQEVLTFCHGLRSVVDCVPASTHSGLKTKSAIRMSLINALFRPHAICFCLVAERAQPHTRAATCTNSARASHCASAQEDRFHEAYARGIIGGGGSSHQRFLPHVPRYSCICGQLIVLDPVHHMQCVHLSVGVVSVAPALSSARWRPRPDLDASHPPFFSNGQSGAGGRTLCEQVDTLLRQFFRVFFHE